MNSVNSFIKEAHNTNKKNIKTLKNTSFNDIINLFLKDKDLIQLSDKSITKADTESNTNSDNSESVDNTFVKVIEKKIITNIYSHIMRKLLDKEVQESIMSELKIDKIVDIFNESPKLLTRKRKPRNITDCPHTDRKHYAKNMCENCYHTLGRRKQPWKCEHADKYHYAHGLCQNCYQIQYVI